MNQSAILSMTDADQNVYMVLQSGAISNLLKISNAGAVVFNTSLGTVESFAVDFDPRTKNIAVLHDGVVSIVSSTTGKVLDLIVIADFVSGIRNFRFYDNECIVLDTIGVNAQHTVYDLNGRKLSKRVLQLVPNQITMLTLVPTH